jgi:hypothetical protein
VTGPRGPDPPTLTAQQAASARTPGGPDLPGVRIFHASQVIANSTVATFVTGGLIELTYAKGFAGSSPVLSQIRLTAWSVGTLVTQP